MNYFTVIGIGIGLAMDALTVSIANGLITKNLKFSYAFRLAFSFGFFQAIMPVIGWAAGLSFRSYIQSVDHWIAFGLLSFIGGRMILEALGSSNGKRSTDCSTLPTLILLSFATSIDALAVGLSFSMLKINIITPALIIGIVTFIICIIGIYIGNRIGHFFEKKIEFVGGVILILIGLKILGEHLL